MSSGAAAKTKKRDGSGSNATTISSTKTRWTALGTCKWAAERLRPPFSAAIIARRGAGKTTLARDLVRALARSGVLGNLLVYTPTGGLSGDWDGVAEPLPFSEESLKHYIQEHSNRLRAAQANPRPRGGSSGVGVPRGREEPLITIVFDDQNERQFHDSEAVRWLYANGRHLLANVISLVQFPSMLGPAARGNCDHLFIGPQAGDGLRGAYQLVAWPDGEFKDFQQQMNELHGERGAFAVYSSAEPGADAWRLVQTRPRRYRLVTYRA